MHPDVSPTSMLGISDDLIHIRPDKNGSSGCNTIGCLELNLECQDAACDRQTLQLEAVMV